MKRALDILLAGLALLVLAPVLVVLALLIRIIDGPPVLFKQVRPGLHAVPFTMLKFRTMRPKRDEGRSDTDSERLTGLGRLLRKLSLDELPELYNVLRGDMSLVGPRPLLMEYLPLYTAAQARRHEVRPGLTGWAQVHGRNALDWEERFRLDLWYVEHRTLWLDLKILARTVGRVMTGAGVSAEGHATMSRFRGTRG